MLGVQDCFHLSSHAVVELAHQLQKRRNNESKLFARKADSYFDIISYPRRRISFAPKEYHPLLPMTLRWREIVDASMGAVFEEGRLLV